MCRTMWRASVNGRRIRWGRFLRLLPSASCHADAAVESVSSESQRARQPWKARKRMAEHAEITSRAQWLIEQRGVWKGREIGCPWLPDVSVCRRR